MKIMTIIASIICCSLTYAALANNQRINRHGVEIINGKSAYIDVAKLDQSVMVISKEYIEKRKAEGTSIIKAGRLLFEKKDHIITYDTMENFPYIVIESEIEYRFKIENNKMYLSKNNKEWDELKIKIINEPKNPQKGRLIVPVFMVIYLKCKWFEGEYEIIGTTG